VADNPESRKQVTLIKTVTLAAHELTIRTDNCQPGFSTLQVSFIMAINTATDLYLMAIPLPVRAAVQTWENP
jgi:hypothetical protein